MYRACNQTGSFTLNSIVHPHLLPGSLLRLGSRFSHRSLSLSTSAFSGHSRLSRAASSLSHSTAVPALPCYRARVWRPAFSRPKRLQKDSNLLLFCHLLSTPTKIVPWRVKPEPAAAYRQHPPRPERTQGTFGCRCFGPSGPELAQPAGVTRRWDTHRPVPGAVDKVSPRKTLSGRSGALASLRGRQYPGRLEGTTGHG